ncbi:DUF1501 domain-containing protein [Novosphingobium sp. ERN07]|uniref:DUF1501 domain-containing protein n=1 Tax=Novosphingobium sp. ERN07 TaxID=2726187 RepID=UPI001F0FE1D5|nr:DUF1501 domain-containing protein [Novosphingobium sp. ERN07]
MTKYSRRSFIKDGSLLSIAGATSPFVLNLAAIGEAAAATASDYKALVCVFMYGGNDYANTLVPYDQDRFSSYSQLRPSLAYNHESLDATRLDPVTPLPSGAQYALAPALSKLHPIFQSGKMAVMLNLGTLIEPTTKAQYLSRSTVLPPKLMSHNDQQSFWQASGAEGAKSGWGGRVADLVQSGNGNSMLTCVSVSGNAVFLSGNSAIQYAITPSGPIALNAGSALGGSALASDVLKEMIGGSLLGNHLFQEEYGKIGSRSLKLYSQINSAISGGPTIGTVFPSSVDPQSTLSAQLKMVARLVSVGKELGMKRQIFFVSTGRFDTHSSLKTVHPVLLENLADALRAFYDATVELGVSEQVTTFTGSDFGRTLTSNNDGSDHGWGSMHFVLGGAVKGGRYYGTNPVLANGGPDDIGLGRLIPTMSVNQYAATLAKWFGVPAGDLPLILPHLPNFVGSKFGTDLGFMA